MCLTQNEYHRKLRVPIRDISDWLVNADQRNADAGDIQTPRCDASLRSRGLLSALASSAGQQEKSQVLLLVEGDAFDLELHIYALTIYFPAWHSVSLSCNLDMQCTGPS
jgi:hypothetical protein